MRINKIRTITTLIGALTVGLFLSIQVMAEDYQLLETHYTDKDNNKADINLLFEQIGVHEKFQLRLFNSNPVSPVIVINLSEIESMHTPSGRYSEHPLPTSLQVAVWKNLVFHPSVLSGMDSTSSMEFNFINPPYYTKELTVGQRQEQPLVNYQIGAVWNEHSLVLTFQQNGQRPTEINVTQWASKRGVKLTHTPKLSRIEVWANNNQSNVIVSSEYQLTESLGLSFPLLRQAFGATKKTLDSPEVFWSPSVTMIEKVLLDTYKKIRQESASLIYLLTPSIESFPSPDAQNIAHSAHWAKTTKDQDSIYIVAMKVAQENLFPRERVIQIDDQYDEIILPKAQLYIDRFIHLRPKNSDVKKSWSIASRMVGSKGISHMVCEYSVNDKDCRIYSTTPLNLENRMVFLSRDASGNVKVWLGAREYEQIDITGKFPDIGLVEEFEFSERFQKTY